jgi:hypothetical protein
MRLQLQLFDPAAAFQDLEIDLGDPITDTAVEEFFDNVPSVANTWL